MKCIVTGVAGFIGSTLCERLLSQGFEVVGIDSFTDYYPRALKEKNIERLKKSSNFVFIEGNLLDLDLASIISDNDYIFHQAAQAGVRTSWGKNFHIYTENNIRATQHLLDNIPASISSAGSFALVRLSSSLVNCSALIKGTISMET